MIGECWAIIAVVLITAYTFVRAHKNSSAGATLPLMIVPFVHILSGGLTRLLLGFIHLPAVYLTMAINTAGLVVACLLIGGISRCITSKAIRRMYLIVCGGFSILLNLVLIYPLIAGLLP